MRGRRTIRRKWKSVNVAQMEIRGIKSTMFVERRRTLVVRINTTEASGGRSAARELSEMKAREEETKA